MRALIRNVYPGRAVAVVALVLAAGCTGGSPNFDYKTLPDPRNKELTLGVGDLIAINVWENNNLNTEATIRPDNNITMPLIGDVKAAGETPSTLKVKIKSKLQDYVKLNAATEITIAVKSWRSYRFTIQGEVSRPGVFTSDQFMRVADALALAGGLTRFAKRSELTLLRRDAKTGELLHIPLSYEDLASGKRPEMNVFIYPGDTIWVP